MNQFGKRRKTGGDKETKKNTERDREEKRESTSTRETETVSNINIKTHIDEESKAHSVSFVSTKINRIDATF